MARWDHVTCNRCKMIKTDSRWGIAKNKWFKSLNKAKFYQKHGRLLETI